MAYGRGDRCRSGDPSVRSVGNANEHVLARPAKQPSWSSAVHEARYDGTTTTVCPCWKSTRAFALYTQGMETRNQTTRPDWPWATREGWIGEVSLPYPCTLYCMIKIVTSLPANATLAFTHSKLERTLCSSFVIRQDRHFARDGGVRVRTGICFSDVGSPGGAHGASNGDGLVSLTEDEEYSGRKWPD
ncbi:hypothetical protein LX36DRAFT_284498 [Colletotrichum falcatum]|nr:hypothetical protein LX36DRAFT_284498 [Colletotrichum falcatum]